MSAIGRGGVSGESFWETMLLWALGGFAAISAVLWAVGGVASFVFGGGWPRAGAAEMPGILGRLPDHLGDPAAAWPPTDRGRLPGPVGFYAVALVLAVAAGAAVYGVLHLRSGRRKSTSGKGAEWATSGDLRTLVVPEPAPGRLVLGRLGRRLVAAEARQSVIVFGPTQTGKTTSLAIPAILEWQGPVVATSVKSDLLRDSLVARTAIPGADVFVYDPTGATGIPATTWSPLAGCGSWRGAQRTAWSLAHAARGGAGGLNDADFWYSSAAKLLAPLLFAANQTGQSMEIVVEWIDTVTEQDVVEILDAVGDNAASSAFAATVNREARTRSSVYTTAETILQAYADPAVLASADGSELRADRLLDGGWHTTYLCAPAHEQQRLQPLFATLVNEIITAVYERAAFTGRPLDPPLLVVLDECANIAPLRDLATIASTGAGQGIQLVTVFQDMAQIDAVYGRDRAPTIVSNHRAKIVLPGIADESTLRYADRLLGDEEITQSSSTRGHTGDRSTTESLAFRSLVPAHELRQMRQGEALLVYGRLPPARLRLRPWYAESSLTGRARPTAAR